MATTLKELERLTQFLSKTDGRDKIYRTLQYGCRLVGHVLAGGMKVSPDSLSAKLTKVSSALSDGRKLLRLFKWLNDVLKLSQIYSSAEPMHMQILNVGKSVFNLLYYLVDNTQWLGKVGLIQVDNARLSKHSGRFWMISLILAIIIDMITYQGLLAKRRKLLVAPQLDKEQVKGIDGKLSTLHLSFLRNSCDMPIAVNAASAGSLSAGTTGFLGLISSAVGLYSLYPPPVAK
eukprot:TRINITY_DN12748_c0_g1_i1.p1 TRINITY_DN12748_c0_g1~~TRINITY_DN12748_c0_g1_i1.p1  ORF type:complete len:245 (-),score=33.18 TRINITY_DN12748_c0_g1_i1:176-874(-)